LSLGQENAWCARLEWADVSHDRELGVDHRDDHHTVKDFLFVAGGNLIDWMILVFLLPVKFVL
jgi:hypothetical protein